MEEYSVLITAYMQKDVRKPESHGRVNKMHIIKIQ